MPAYAIGPNDQGGPKGQWPLLQSAVVQGRSCLIGHWKSVKPDCGKQNILNTLLATIEDGDSAIYASCSVRIANDNVPDRGERGLWVG